MVQKELNRNANSKGVMLDFLGVDPIKKDKFGVLGQSSDFDIDIARKVVLNDPVVKAAIITLVDKVMEAGWRLTPDNKKSNILELEKTLKKTRFNKTLKKILYNLFAYNNSFVEIVMKNGSVSDLNVIETSTVKIVAEDNGDVVSYYQDVGRLSNNPTWTPEQIVHFKLDDMSTNVWSDLNIKSIYETVLIKDYIRQWLQWFFGTNQRRPIISLKGADKVKVEAFLGYLKSIEKKIKQPIPIQGEFEIKYLNELGADGQNIMNILSWCDEQILILLQTPPISIGKADASGRSNSVEQYAGLNTRVHSIHKNLEDDITFDLFPKINFDKVSFRFGALDMGASDKIFNTVQVMKNSMFSDEAILEFLESQGVVFDVDKVFNKPEDLLPKESGDGLSNKSVGTGNEGMLGNKSADSAPSRQRQGNGQLSKANQSSMVRNSFNNYPYTYEVLSDE